jgi:putative nucleotidyltransferase with HDIG domain
MKIPLRRQQAWQLVLKYNKEQANLDHYLESEAIMRGLARKFGEDEEYWGMLGLLHDVDWELCKDDWHLHLTKAPEILKENGFDDEFIGIVVSHGYGFDCAGLKNKVRTKKIEHALAASETISGLIFAYALMRGRKITDMDASGLKKKFKDKRFAENCRRDIIQEIEKTGLNLDEYFQIAIDSLKNIKEEIGLN